MCACRHFSCVKLLLNLWTVACQAPLSMGFSRQEYWSGLPCSPPGDFPNTGIKPVSLPSNLHWQVGSLPLVPPGDPFCLYAHILLALFFWRTLTNTPSVHTHTLILFLSLCSRPSEARTNTQLCCSVFHLFLQCLYQTKAPPGLNRSACSPCLVNTSACPPCPVNRSACSPCLVFSEVLGTQQM